MDILDFGLYLGYILLVAAALVAIVMPLFRAVTSPGSLKVSGIAVGVIVVLGVISYVVSSSAVSAQQASLGITPTVSKLIGAGLILLYIVLALAVITLVYSEITKATK